MLLSKSTALVSSSHRSPCKVWEGRLSPPKRNTRGFSAREPDCGALVTFSACLPSSTVRALKLEFPNWRFVLVACLSRPEVLLVLPGLKDSASLKLGLGWGADFSS